MSLESIQSKTRYIVILMVLVTLAVVFQGHPPANAQQAGISPAVITPVSIVHLPMISDNNLWPSPFGFEASSKLLPGSVMLTRATAMNARWVRMGNQVSWKDLQPVENDPNSINFAIQLVGFNAELVALNSAGITPVITINRSPDWAVIPPKNPEAPLSSCAAIKPEKYTAFAQFVGALVKFYSVPPYNIHHWELGNEPDIDPILAPPDSGYGCWGDMADTNYYGGQRYGEMLKVVAPVMRSRDPSVSIWIGGLLLDNPNSSGIYGKPENFLKGILAAGAAPYFDVIPYHWHPGYFGGREDYDLKWNAWAALGGGTVGKARFLRQIMAEYGVSKPLVLNETGFGCRLDSNQAPCDLPETTPGEDFITMQAEHLVRALTRALSERVSGFFWYTLNGPGWRNSGLLTQDQAPRPSFEAYQVMSLQLNNANYVGLVDYGAGIEAYQFLREGDLVQVVWTTEDVAGGVAAVAQAKFKHAYSLNNTEIVLPPPVGGFYQVPVGFSPVYIIRAP